MSTHPANTIPDEVWHSFAVRASHAVNAERIRFGPARLARRARLAGLQHRAARAGRN